ncbi:MAG: glycosyltransferase family 4 protein [Candidatus Harrisonbacteria bacterium CG10_big_fil_rev_8_21_14_0_10_45_28]|uniref:Glycosyltransferase family 4 protein n=1 Tax=Candidatus Harrisonbacteria bacterium CG10_big_fil_rev_8_21_14_0_10_45_28 TaxID=1974586 RepID=A0A2H0UPZ2_9BACT|nr:MAG: glycosyltransferase family 4 protein [Candidatus Harrisonbacteria bacterium CG10_big_fil_rev_8_21_14_0_10_45_28]
MQTPKIALVHDYLNQLGGGERVLSELMAMFPEAPIFTLLYDENKTRDQFKGRVRGTSFLDFQFARDHHRLFIPLMPRAAKSIDLGSEFDLIISDTAGFAKGISYNPKTTKHLCYCHTPLRYAWETETYFNNNPKHLALKILGAPAFAYVRHFDYLAGQRPDKILANSHYIADKIQSYYGRPSEVVYPPVNLEKFYFDPVTPDPLPPTRSYYLALGRLLPYKRFDLIVEAFNKTGAPLKIVGTGPDEKKLRRLAMPNIEFVRYVESDDEVRRLYTRAKAFIMANEEDFGMVMAEAQACGTPIIAYGAGGAKEIIQERTTGLFFKEQNPESLIQAIQRLQGMELDRAKVGQSAQRFSKDSFNSAIRAQVATLLQKN